MKRRSLLGLALVPILLAGCGLFGGGDDATAAEATEVSLAPKSDVFVDTVNSQGEGGFVGAFSDVSASDCSQDGGEWTGTGTVLNPTSDVVSYRVWVAFLDSDGETVGLVESDVDGVGGGASADFSASMPSSDTDTLQCVLRVERRSE